MNDLTKIKDALRDGLYYAQRAMDHNSSLGKMKQADSDEAAFDRIKEALSALSQREVGWVNPEGQAPLDDMDIHEMAKVFAEHRWEKSPEHERCFELAYAALKKLIQP